MDEWMNKPTKEKEKEMKLKGLRTPQVLARMAGRARSTKRPQRARMVEAFMVVVSVGKLDLLEVSLLAFFFLRPLH